MGGNPGRGRRWGAFLSIGIRAAWSGVEAVAKLRDRAKKEYRDRTVAWLTQSAIMVHSEAIKGIQRVSLGRIYTHFLARNTRTGNLFPVRKRKKPHIASKPGEPFNIDTGATIKTIRWWIDKQKLTARVGTTSNVGLWMELGTSSVAARPWLMPAFRKVRSQLRPGKMKLTGVE